MSVEKASAAETQARLLAQKRRALEEEENSLDLQKAKAAQARHKAESAEKAKADKEMVEISKAAERQVEATKKLNTDRILQLNENNNKAYEDIANKTAEALREADANALRQINDIRAGAMEKVKFMSDRAEDPFYRIKSLTPTLSEGDREFTVKMTMPPHEAENLFVSGEGQTLKLSLSRRFQDTFKNPEGGGTTKTNSFQTVVEYVPLPGAYEAKKISRDYADGVLTIHVPKAGLPPEGVEPVEIAKIEVPELKA
jgi:HSP20 family molecular chaperone IbpA